MGLDIAQGIRIIIRVLAMFLADRFLTPADQALVLRLQRMHRHECLSVAEATDSSGLFIDTLSRPVLASRLRVGESGAPTPRSQH